MFSYVSAEERIPQDHPLRAIRVLVDEILREMSRDFSRLYATTGRPSIPPERLLRAQLLQILYSIRSERLLVEQLHYNILFRWFVGLTMDDAVWTPTVFTKNRDRLLNDTIAGRFFHRVVQRAQPYMSDGHFTVEGTLIEAWASQKSFQPKNEPPADDGHNFHGQTRTNDTHASTSDPDATLYRKTERRGPAVVPRPSAARKPPRAHCRRDGDDRGRDGRARRRHAPAAPTVETIPIAGPSAPIKPTIRMAWSTCSARSTSFRMSRRI